MARHVVANKRPYILYAVGVIYFVLLNYFLSLILPTPDLTWVTPLQLSQRSLQQLGPSEPDRPYVAIVITVHGALPYLSACLNTWRQHTTDSHVYLVDDCDSAAERTQLEKLAFTYSNVTVIPREGSASIGYTKAVNAGLRAAYEQGYPYIAQLNSDTLLTPNWLPPLVAVLDGNPRAGAVGPIGNAATWQSVPEVTTPKGSWSKNPLPQNMTIDMMARLTSLLSNNRPIELPILNGFCILYRRDVFAEIGYMDDVLSPRGYGEENDFAFRLRKHGYSLWTTPSSYVFHHKGKSFKKEEYVSHIAETKSRMKERYGRELKEAETALKTNVALQHLRSTIQQHVIPSIPSLQRQVSVIFVLNIMSTKKPFMLHGGWISLVQEALGLWTHGALVKIAVPLGYVDNFNQAFPQAEDADIFLGFSAKTPQDVADEIVHRGQVFDFVVATHSSTADTVMQIIRHWPNAIPSYYVQDIETEFKDGPAGEAAFRSYRDLKHGFIFVKTPWLQQRLRDEFGIDAYLISPTVDTKLFTPGNQSYRGPLQLCAMVRVSTPRRKPKETLQLLSWAAKMHGVKALAFGSSEENIAGFLDKEGDEGIDLHHVQILGILDRRKMRQINQVCEVFLDFSTWQAFGRSGIEAMASGVIPILPKDGGVKAYARPGENAFLIDTSDVAATKRLLEDIVKGKHNLRVMREEALATADRFSLDKVSKQTYGMFIEFLGQWRAERASFVDLGVA